MVNSCNLSRVFNIATNYLDSLKYKVILLLFLYNLYFSPIVIQIEYTLSSPYILRKKY